MEELTNQFHKRNSLVKSRQDEKCPTSPNELSLDSLRIEDHRIEIHREEIEMGMGMGHATTSQAKDDISMCPLYSAMEEVAGKEELTNLSYEFIGTLG